MVMIVLLGISGNGRCANKRKQEQRREKKNNNKKSPSLTQNKKRIYNSNIYAQSLLTSFHSGNFVLFDIILKLPYFGL